VNLLSLSLHNPRRLILAWLRCMGASARESRVSVAIHSLDVVGRPVLHQSSFTSLCFVGCFSPGPRKNDLMIYWALGPFVRSFTPLVDPGDIYPPHPDLRSFARGRLGSAGDEGVQILREVHSGTCGSHARPRALAAKVIRQGFYWLAMICAANRVTRSCEACQKFSPRSGSPLQFTKLIAHTWPLQRWGLDIVGPLPTAQGNLKFTFVAVEYFTKWIEVMAVSTITSKTAQKFFWQNIVCRFGVPSELTVDNGKQFDSQDFKDFCFSIGTKLAFASVYHPQSNGVVECTNGKIFTAVKKMLLDDKKGK
jgi:hypothetical protein